MKTILKFANQPWPSLIKTAIPLSRIGLRNVHNFLHLVSFSILLLCLICSVDFAIVWKTYEKSNILNSRNVRLGICILLLHFFFFFKLQTFFSLHCRILLELRDNYCMVTRSTGVCIYWNEILEEKFLFENLHETNISKEWRKFCLRIYFSLLIFNDLEIILKCSSYLLNEIRSPWTFRIVPKWNSYSRFCRLCHHEYVYTFHLKSTLSSNERIRRIFLPSPHE